MTKDMTTGAITPLLVDFTVPLFCIKVFCLMCFYYIVQL